MSEEFGGLEIRNHKWLKAPINKKLRREGGLVALKNIEEEKNWQEKEEEKKKGEEPFARERGRALVENPSLMTPKPTR